MLPRSISVLLISLLLPIAGALHAQHAHIQAKAEEAMAATMEGDFEKLIDLTYPGVIELAGGRQGLQKIIEKGTEELKAAGFTFDSVKVRGPIRIVKSRRRSFAVIPYDIVMSYPKGRIFQEAIMLGISEDKGKSWTFIEINKGMRHILGMIFPDEKNLERRLSLPESFPPPRFEEN